MADLDTILSEIFPFSGAGAPDDGMRLRLQQIADLLAPLGVERLTLADVYGVALLSWKSESSSPSEKDPAPEEGAQSPSSNDGLQIRPFDEHRIAFALDVVAECGDRGLFRGRLRPSDGIEATTARLLDLRPWLQLVGNSLFTALRLAETVGRQEERFEQISNQYETLQAEHARTVAGTLEMFDDRLRDQQRYATQLEADVAARTRELTESQASLKAYAERLDFARAFEEGNARQLRQLVEELEISKRQAEQAAECKSSFLANMSHEIRTPLTAILGYSDLLLNEEDATDATQRTELIQTIHRNGRYLLDLINDILDLSKIEADRVQMERIPCSPVEIVRDVLDLMQLRAKARNLLVLAEYPGPIPHTIVSDPTRLRQILINLVGNAVKFTESGSVRVVVSVDRQAEQPRMRFDVIDTGIGMSEAQMAGLFQPFTQADASTTRRFGGTGLGLAICKRLAELMEGTIAVSSCLSKGSTFGVVIPCGPLDGVEMIDQPLLQKTAAAPPEAAAPAARLAGCRVLLAEDGPDNQRLISFVLKKAGAQVTVVDNGKLAVEKAIYSLPGRGRRKDDPKEPFHVVLMDMQMPVLDGYGAARQLRDEGCQIPIVALTANTMQGDRDKCLEAGCIDYLMKPIDRRQLIDTIAKYAGLSGTTDAAIPAAPDVVTSTA